MSQRYVGTSSAYYTLIEPALGKGGEGSVYKISEKPNYVVKIYNDKHRTEKRHRKILAMLKISLSSEAMKQITWPVDVVYDNGRFVGYVMPETKNNENLNVMYSDNTYICPLNEKIQIAKNLCAAIDSVHKVGQVCGDLNPNNIKINPKTDLVTLVDTDSFGIDPKDKDSDYRCEVGMPEYLAKEVHEALHNNKGKDLRTLAKTPFSVETDLFALAVHIFALLMNGSHPFSCAVDNGSYNIKQLTYTQSSVVCPQPIDNIKNGFFPFYMKKPNITTPKYAPGFDILPQNIQNLFIRAFVDGSNDPSKRPSEEEWYNELSVMQQNLKTCPKDSSHLFPTHNKACPWCEIKNNMLPVVASKQSSKSTNTRNVNNSSNVVSSSSKKTSTVQISIKRDAWPMWVLFSIVGLITGPIEAHYIAMPLIYDIFDLDIPMIAGYIVMGIVGILSGVFISHFAQEKYQSSDKGWPWLLLSLCVPLLAFAATAILVAAIALVVGILYVALFILVIAIGGAIAAACCGG